MQRKASFPFAFLSFFSYLCTRVAFSLRQVWGKGSKKRQSSKPGYDEYRSETRALLPIPKKAR